LLNGVEIEYMKKESYDFFIYSLSLKGLVLEVSHPLGKSNFSTMSKTFEQKQVLVKTLKKAVNSFVYSPSEEKKSNLSEAMASLSSFIDSIDVPTPEPPKKEAKKKSSKTSKSKPSKASKSKPSKKSLTSKESDRKSEIEALLSSGKKMKRAERSVLNKELFALQTKERTTSSSKRKSKSKAVRRPKRTSKAGLELTQAKTATANKVGKVKKTKVVNAVDGGEAQPFEPRKEVPVVEPKVRRKEQMKLTLLEGETPQEAMARHRSAVLEQERLEALALIAETAPF
jgi:hypothetical protein